MNTSGFTENSLSNTVTQLQTPEVQAALGDRAVRLARMIEEQAFVPNVRGNSITFSRGQLDGDGIPVVALLPGTYKIDRAIRAPMPMQQANIARRLKHEYGDEDALKYPRSLGNFSTLRRDVMPTAEAAVFRESTTVMEKSSRFWS